MAAIDELASQAAATEGPGMEPRVRRGDNQRLDQALFMREKLFGGSKSSFRRYKDMVVGEQASALEFVYYELVTTLCGRLSGALGIVLRKLLYPRLFRGVGKGVIFGRDLIIRHGQNITLGDQAVLDDGCFLDGRGAGADGVVIGDRVVVGRYSIIQAKIGAISIGSDTDIGSGSVIVAQGGVEIGKGVVLGGNAKVSGGVFHVERDPRRVFDTAKDRGHSRWTQGPIRIADRCMFGDECDRAGRRGARRGDGDRCRNRGDARPRALQRGRGGPRAGPAPARRHGPVPDSEKGLASLLTIRPDGA